MLQIFRYLNIFFAKPESVSFSFDGTEALILELRLKSKVPDDKLLSAHGLSIAFRNERAVIRVPYYRAELKHFFKDYKNYYYLPEEDVCVHKSVGSFMQTSVREKASASNCYIKKEDCFLPQFRSELFSPSFREDYKSKENYFVFEEKNFDSDKLAEYSCLVLDELKKKEKK